MTFHQHTELQLDRRMTAQRLYVRGRANAADGADRAVCVVCVQRQRHVELARHATSVGVHHTHHALATASDHAVLRSAQKVRATVVVGAERATQVQRRAVRTGARLDESDVVVGA